MKRRMTKNMNDRKDEKNVSRRAVIQAGVATAAALTAPRAEAQISGVGVAQGTLPGRTAPYTLEGTSSTVIPRQKLGIDIHAHYYPLAYLDVIGTDGKPFGGEYTPTPEGYMLKGGGFSGGPFPAKFTDLKLRLADMDAQGVQVHALSLTRPMPYFGSPAFALKLARAFDDACNEAHLQYPTRFVGLMTLPMNDRDRAIDELNRASKLPGIRGVYLGCNVEGRDFSDPEFLPIFKRIEALSLPVL